MPISLRAVGSGRFGVQVHQTGLVFIELVRDDAYGEWLAADQPSDALGS